MDTYSINSRILILLKNNKAFSQKSLAAYIKCPPNTLSTWLTKNRSIPAEMLIPICDYFHVSPSFLLTGVEASPCSSLNSDEEAFIHKYRQLSNNDKEELMLLVDFKLKNIKRAEKLSPSNISPNNKKKEII